MKEDISFNAIDEPFKLESWLEEYLTPKKIGGGGARAHQFTINGLTYQFIKNYHFAAVPDVPKARRYDMQSSFHLPLIGDLIYFFQADPQDPGGGIHARRGIRGIYRVIGLPYRQRKTYKISISGYEYQLLPKCPKCKTPNALFGDKCYSCREDYPASKIKNGNDGFHTFKVFSCNLPIEPLFPFEYAISDERAYADFSDPGIVWIGRHDNAMGLGKGASIRQLLPEEAVKLGRLLAKEPDQKYYKSKKIKLIKNPLPLTHFDAKKALPLKHYNTKNSILSVPIAGIHKYQVDREDELYYVITKQIYDSNSSIRQAIKPYFPKGVNWGHMEYASSTFPWGYTGNAADYVIFFRNATGRRFIVVVECKKDNAHDETTLQVLLYVERVLQVAFLSAPKEIIPKNGAHILPVVVACDVRKPMKEDDKRLALPAKYKISREYFGKKVSATVNSPIFLKYKHNQADGVKFGPANKFTFEEINSAEHKTINWNPLHGQVGTAAEMDWILKGSWKRSRS